MLNKELRKRKTGRCFHLLHYVTLCNIKNLPNFPGIYVLLDGNVIYVGSSKDIKKRSKVSSINHRLNGYVFFFLLDYLIFENDPKMNSAELKSIREDIEASCINAFATYVEENGIPLDVKNRKDYSVLPQNAHLRDRPGLMHLGMDIAEAVMYHIGVPLHLTSVQCPETRIDVITRIRRDFTQENFRMLMDMEAENRKKRGMDKNVMLISEYKSTINPMLQKNLRK